MRPDPGAICGLLQLTCGCDGWSRRRNILPDVLVEAHHGGASCNQFGASGFALVCGNGAALDMKQIFRL